MSLFQQTTRAIVQRCKRLVRTAQGADWSPPIERRVRTLRLGGNGAAWTVAPEYLCKESIVWSVGVGEDISFDEKLHDHFGMRIDAFDPTPRSLAWLRARGVPDWFHLHPIGLAGKDGIASFRPPANPMHVSFAMLTGATNHTSTGDITADVRCLASLALQLGHRAIDLLKMDIEGAEQQASRGASQTIQTHRPVLAVSLYHRPADLWEIPLLIEEISPGYRMYLRVYGDMLLETVLYCLPDGA